VRHATDGFIGILDMFGFEDPKVSWHGPIVKFWAEVRFTHTSYKS
jgi:hypothetical protein